MLWSIELGRYEAIERLPKCPDLTPCLRMELARQYDIEEWIGPSFSALVDRELNSFSPKEIEAMGMDVYVVLSQTIERIAKERLYVAYVCPDTRKAEQCQLEEHQACIKDWQNSWWDGFSKHLLHPEKFLWGENAIAKLQAGNFTVMKESCLDLTIKKIWLSNRFNYREVFIEQGIQRLLANQNERKKHRIVGPAPKLFSNVNGEVVVVPGAIVNKEPEIEEGEGGGDQIEVEQLVQQPAEYIEVEP